MLYHIISEEKQCEYIASSSRPEIQTEATAQTDQSLWSDSIDHKTSLII